MDPCAFILRESSSRWKELHDDVLVIPSGDVGPLGSLCGILGVHVGDQINGGRGARRETAMKRLRARLPVMDLFQGMRSQAPGWNSSPSFSAVQSKKAYACQTSQKET